MGSLSVVAALEAARARVAHGWLQGKSFARSEDNHIIAWCMSGAINHGDADDSNCSGCSAGDLLARITGEPLASWNDAPGRTQAQVLAAFDKAILLARSAQ